AAASAGADGAADIAESGPDSVAALPLVSPADSGSMLPLVLSDADVALYRRIFDIQEEGRWKEASKLIAQLGDRVLMGHVLAQKYLHPTRYRSRFAELRDWLARYNDHPQARRIYRLALQRMPKGAAQPQAPVPGYLYGTGASIAAAGPGDYVSDKKQSREDLRQVRQLMRRMHGRIRGGWPTGALQILQTGAVGQLFNSLQYDTARADIAMGYFAFHKDLEAFELAAPASRRSGRWLATANWTAGLAAWRLGRVEEARHHFELQAESPAASPWLQSAGAFWAARASLLTRKPILYNQWLEAAAEHPRTFYGLLARRLLGIEMNFTWDSPALSEVHLARLANEPAGRRAMALVQVGRHDLAERDLRKLYARDETVFGEAIAAMAAHGNMPALAMRLSGILSTGDDAAYDGARYPVPLWQPAGGYAVDRALLLAFARQESNFNPQALSPAGARGLMQLMPRTASYIAGDSELRRKRDALYDPALNLDLGQRYLSHLLVGEGIDGDLLLLAAAYNGGPGKLARWRGLVDHDQDPLLFIESIPSPETRIFIERVLTNLWIYRHRLGQPTPSLDALAMGLRPTYLPLDGQTPAEPPSHAAAAGKSDAGN
ncbi:MAG: lytic transglycosylase domain-containing protein, partial [Acetobacterales bacterium]